MFGIPGMLIPYYNHEWFDLSLLFSPIAGVLPAVVVISLFQNNPIRWLLAVRKYEQCYLQKTRRRNMSETLLPLGTVVKLRSNRTNYYRQGFASRAKSRTCIF